MDDRKDNEVRADARFLILAIMDDRKENEVRTGRPLFDSSRSDDRKEDKKCMQGCPHFDLRGQG